MADPIDPYANQGAEQNIDRQKALLNDIVVSQGQAGRQIYERQPAESQAALQQQLASAPSTPDARKAVFDSYINDAKLAEQGQTDFMQRQSLLNSNFLDQAKAAVPIHATDVKNQQEALRMQFEDQQNARAQAAANSRAASGPKTVEQRIAEGIDTANVNAGVRAALLKDVPRNQWTVSDAEKAGTAKGKASYMDAASELGYPPGFGLNATPETKQQISEVQAWLDDLAKKDVSFDEAVGQVRSAVDDGLYSNDIADVILQANARRWGITDPADWGRSTGQKFRP